MSIPVAHRSASRNFVESPQGELRRTRLLRSLLAPVGEQEPYDVPPHSDEGGDKGQVHYVLPACLRLPSIDLPRLHDPPTSTRRHVPSGTFGRWRKGATTREDFAENLFHALG